MEPTDTGAQLINPSSSHVYEFLPSPNPTCGSMEGLLLPWPANPDSTLSLIFKDSCNPDLTLHAYQGIAQVLKNHRRLVQSTAAYWQGDRQVQMHVSYSTHPCHCSNLPVSDQES